VNLCRACGEDFGSVAAFDAHRVGRHAYTYSEGARMDPVREDGRRCLSVEELHERGFVRNARGRWSIASHAERGRALKASSQRGVPVPTGAH
jgi:hypothetical protein